MRGSLTPAEVNFLQSSSSNDVIDCARMNKKYLARQRWLGDNNVYGRHAIDQLRKDKNVVDPKNAKHLREYIVSSVPLHLFDAWNYFGQALYAQLRGASSLAIHLSYYAELRAAMSLLASQGIGVFDQNHYCIGPKGRIARITDKDNKGKEIRRGTHQAAWLYFEEWTKQKRSSDLLGEIIVFQSTSLVDWFDSISWKGVWAPTAQEILQDYGLDLRHMSNDRKFRNEASYRPNDIVGTNIVDISQRVDLLMQMVEATLVTNGVFPLDKYMVRSAIEKTRRSALRNGMTIDGRTYRNEIDRIVAMNVSGAALNSEVAAFILRQKAHKSEPLIFGEASRLKSKAYRKQHVPIMCRTLMLLRIVTGAVRKFLKSADISLEEIAFWWRVRGIELGLWTEDFMLDQIDDIWVDVEESLELFELWLDAGGQSVYEFCSDHFDRIQHVTNVGRVAIFGLV